MIKISIRTNFPEVARKLEEMADKQGRFAMAVALTRTAKDVRDEVVAVMSSVLDKPTRYTLRSMKFSSARKDSLTASVFMNGAYLGKNQVGSPAHVLGHQFAGGARTAKKLELILRRNGLISAGEYVVPGAGARIDRYGNMSRGQVVQLMSQMRLLLDSSSWRQRTARSKANRRTAGHIFWSHGNHLPRGAWIDKGGEIGVRPLLIVIKATRYGRRIDLASIASKVIPRSFPRHFSLAWKQAKATAR